jgi:hypothetical protein
MECPREFCGVHRHPVSQFLRAERTIGPVTPRITE